MGEASGRTAVIGYGNDCGDVGAVLFEAPEEGGESGSAADGDDAGATGELLTLEVATYKSVFAGGCSDRAETTEEPSRSAPNAVASDGHEDSSNKVRDLATVGLARDLGGDVVPSDSDVVEESLQDVLKAHMNAEEEYEEASRGEKDVAEEVGGWQEPVLEPSSLFLCYHPG